MAKVNDREVLRPGERCNTSAAANAPPARREAKKPSLCPLHNVCPRWTQQDDYYAAMEETIEESERRRATWPCSRLLELLHPNVRSIGR